MNTEPVSNLIALPIHSQNRTNGPELMNFKMPSTNPTILSKINFTHGRSIRLSEYPGHGSENHPDFGLGRKAFSKVNSGMIFEWR